MRKYDIAIIGFGPAGMACAIQLVRMGYQPVVFEKSSQPGLLQNAHLVENYPGFPGGITGAELQQKFLEHSSHFEINIIKENIIQADYQDDNFLLKSEANEYSSKILVIASGTEPVAIEGIDDQLINSGKVHTTLRNLVHVNNSIIGIIGAGDAAFDYALSLADKNNDVFIFNRSGETRSLEILKSRALKNPGIHYKACHVFKSIAIGKDLKIYMTFLNGTSYSLDHLIFATGRKPALSFCSQELLTHQEELLNSHRLFFVGDVINDRYRQVAIAVGDGIRTALEIDSHGSL